MRVYPCADFSSWPPSAFPLAHVDAQARPIRVLVYHDMEGLAGQDNPFSYRFDHPADYAKGREMLVADVNAVISGLFDGGATEVNVIDAHGSGNPEPDIPAGALDPRAKQIFRDTPFRGYVDLVEPNRYDAVAAVAMHSKTGSRGFAAHTITTGDRAGAQRQGDHRVRAGGLFLGQGQRAAHLRVGR